MREIKIPVYKLKELKDNIRDNVIQDHLDFLINTAYTTDTKEDIEARRLYTEEEAIESININEYEYFENGELIPVNQYLKG